MRRLRAFFHSDQVAYLMIAPFFLLFTVFVLVPIGYNVVLSFANFNLRTFSFVGLANYRTVFKDPLFLKALQNTIVYAVFTVLITVVLSFLLSLLLNRSGWFMKVSRSVFYLPNVVSMVAVSTIWKFMYNPYFGIFNSMLTSIGIPAQTFLLDVGQAMACIIVMSVWKSVGYNMVLFLAGLQGIPKEIYEAAAMDGAHGFRMTWHITLPSIRPVTFFVLMTCCISAFSVFDQVKVMTDGGPMNSTTTIVHQIYSRGFSEFRLGYAAAMAIVLAVIVLLFTAVSFRLNTKNQGDVT